MKRGGFLKRRTPLKSKTRTLHTRADNDTNRIKDEIQETVRQIVIARDGGCIFSFPADDDVDLSNVPDCNGYAKDGHLILQADHLITRANAATYPDTRLIVCVCKGHHGWKRWNEARYNEIVRTLIGKERCKLWDKMHDERYKPTRKFTYDWNLELAALKQELFKMHRVV
jgi:hypothetical protein